MMTHSTAGFREIEHTADWELEVWAPDLPALLEQAGRGMYALAGVRLALEGRASANLRCAFDAEKPAGAFPVQCCISPGRKPGLR
jgi:hypothetical protein